MQQRKRAALAAALVAGAAGLSGCGTTSTPAAATQSTQATQTVEKVVTEVVKTVTATAPTPASAAASSSTKSAPSAKSVSSASASAPAGPKVPAGLVHETLTQAEQTLEDRGIDYTTAGGTVILSADWGVCSTTPSAGAPVHGAVVLNIGHFSCGAGPSTASAGSSSAQTVPSGLDNETLVQAEQTLDNDGISYTTSGGMVILRGDWGVCSTTPAAGQPIHGAVVLNIGHFSCGAG